jgi:hypothetical protein
LEVKTEKFKIEKKQMDWMPACAGHDKVREAGDRKVVRRR